MEIKVRWLPAADEDLVVVCDFVAIKNPGAASRLYDTLVEAADELLIFPEAGPLEPLLRDRPESFRYLVVASHYKLIYRIKTNLVEIASVWDCRCRPESLVNRLKYY